MCELFGVAPLAVVHRSCWRQHVLEGLLRNRKAGVRQPR